MVSSSFVVKVFPQCGQVNFRVSTGGGGGLGGSGGGIGGAFMLSSLGSAGLLL